MAITDTFYQYFVKPILQNEGYNPVNTLAYGILLILAVLGLYRLSVKLKVVPDIVKIDRNFTKAVLPFVIFAGVIRALNDYGFAGDLRIFFISPFIYITLFSVFFIPFVVGIYLDRMKKLEYWKVPFGASILLLLFAFANIQSIDPSPIVFTLVVTLIWYILFEGLRRKNILPKVFTKDNNYVLTAQMVDGSATFFTLQFYSHLFFEQHFVSRFFIESFGAWSFFILKLAVVPIVLYSLEDVKDPHLRGFLKVVVAILGIAPGLRNAVTTGIRISLL